jgi:hypothetical protein
MLKRILALLLALLLASFALAACKEDTPSPTPDDPNKPGNGLESEAPSKLDGGSLGDTLSWEFYNDGTLYIKGTGAMDELERGEGGSVIQPWHKYLGADGGTAITKVVVEGGVTSIASCAFMNCVKLKEVVIADTVSVIPEKCFKYCESLTKVTARSVTQIEDNAFDSCVKLNTVTFSASLNFVGDGAFLRAGEQAKTFSVRLAGTADEWAAAKAEMDADENDELAIWTGNEKLLTALEVPAFVERPQQGAASD